MILKKVLNNNVVIAYDEKNEYVIFGRGIAFNLNKDDKIPEELIERVFSSKQDKSQLEKLVDTIPQNYFDLSVEIIQYIQDNLDIELSNTIYITLTDHISFIKDRVNKGILPSNSLTWEIKNYYPKEFHLSKKVVELLEEEFECELNDDEAASIALHIVNAEINSESIHESMNNVYLVDQILQIIKYSINFEDCEDDFNYQRLVTHVKFFVQRVLNKKCEASKGSLYNIVKKSYPKAYMTAEKVRGFLENKIKYKINDEEITYLIIHIERLLTHQENS